MEQTQTEERKKKKVHKCSFFPCKCRASTARFGLFYVSPAAREESRWGNMEEYFYLFIFC